VKPTVNIARHLDQRAKQIVGVLPGFMNVLLQGVLFYLRAYRGTSGRPPAVVFVYVMTKKHSHNSFQLILFDASTWINVKPLTEDSKYVAKVLKGAFKSLSFSTF
jgi:hypothetical protein